MTTVYLDVVLVDNFIMDFFILHLSCTLSKNKVKLWQLIVSALVGAGYSVLVIYYPHNMWIVSVFFKLLICGMMTGVIVINKTLKSAVLMFIWLIVITFCAGGIFFFIAYLNPASISTQNGVINIAQQSLKTKIYGLVVTYLLLNYFFKKIYNNKKISEKKADIIITINEKAYTLHGFFDSGNHLKDPKNSYPLPIVQAEKIGFKIESNVMEDEYQFISELVEQLKESTKHFVVTYKTVGLNCAMMLGIYAENLLVLKGDKVIFKSQQYPIALAKEAMQSHEQCEVIIPTDLLDLVI